MGERGFPEQQRVQGAPATLGQESSPPSPAGAVAAVFISISLSAMASEKAEDKSSQSLLRLTEEQAQAPLPQMVTQDITCISASPALWAGLGKGHTVPASCCEWRCLTWGLWGQIRINL